MTSMQSGPANPFLAASSNAIAHGRCDQQDSSAFAGPTGPSEVLTDADRQYASIGPGHFGHLISAPYADGKRVLWSNGRQQIVKLDYDTLEPIATLPIPGYEVSSEDEIDEVLAGLDSLEGKELVDHAIVAAMNYMVGLDGVYSLLDVDNTLFLGRTQEAVAYTDAVPGDRTSGIVERDRWAKPDHIDGSFVGINMSFDGRLVMTTSDGWIIVLERDFSSYESIRLPGAEFEAEAFNDKMVAEGRNGYHWVRTSTCVGDDGGIYVSSCDRHHKVMWTGERLSLDEADGAWVAQYRNGNGYGSGTTPSLMGFGPDEDRFVVLGDGDDVVNITLMWRDEIPEDWEQLPNAPSRRIAGLGPANMGNPDLAAIQTEQSITVSGYGAMTVNNEPLTIPDDYPGQGIRLLVFYLGHKPEYTPHGLHKYRWDPEAREFVEAWVNNDVSSPNSVPLVSEPEDLVYTCGVRDGLWTVEALDWTTGEERFHYVVGNSRFNSLGAGINIDDDGRIVYGNIFGKTRILR